MDKRVLVISSCTGEKLYTPSNKLIQEDFLDKERLKEREKELSEFSSTAGELYTGKQHVALMKGINYYRSQDGKIDLNILSAGYGLLNEDDRVVPYEVTFNSMSGIYLRNWANFLNITEELQTRIQEYDLVFFLLGDRYLQAIDWSILKAKSNTKLIFFAGESSKYRILIRQNHHVIAVTEREAKVFRSGLIEIKGFLFSKLLESIGSNKELWQSIYENPRLVRELILETIDDGKQISMFELNNQKISEPLLPYYSLEVPEEKRAKNYGRSFMYFIPENDDRVDPDYDFIKDQLNRSGNPLDHDVYAHELLESPSYDGILISKVNIDNATLKKRDDIQRLGIRKFLRLPDDYPIMGDCGAFSYLTQENPPYTTEAVLDYYHTLGFDYGVSVDHLIVGSYMKDVKERNRRYELTLRNAQDFIQKYQAGKEKFGYTFTPIGIAQGWDPKSFRNAVQALIDMGYNYVALGGLAREKSLTIYEILLEIAPIIPHENFKMHLFGVVRDNMEFMKVFNQLGVTSFDSASPLRRAWLGSEHNYYCPEKSEKYYAAIRIPDARASSPRIKQQIRNYLRELYFSKSKDMEELRESNFENLEKFTLKMVKAYDLGSKSVGESLSEIKEFSQSNNISLDNLEEYAEIFRMLDRFKELEHRALSSLRAYDKGELDIDSTLQAILDYDETLGEDREKHLHYYRETLKDMPWKRCACRICQNNGVEVIIFRGNNRNRRRGFHNTRVFYKHISSLKEEIRDEVYKGSVDKLGN